MKRVIAFALFMVLSLSLAACRRREDPTPTEATPSATVTEPTKGTMPSVDPTLDTNIPDPTVNSNSTMPAGTDPTDESHIIRNGRSRIYR